MRRIIRGVAFTALAAFLGLPVAASGSEVVVRGDRMTIRAQGVPLVGILDQISQLTGARVLYSGRQPNPAVTITVEEVPLDQALATLFRSVDVDYAVQLGSAGKGNLTILVAERRPPTPGNPAPAGDSGNPAEPREAEPREDAPVEEPALSPGGEDPRPAEAAGSYSELQPRLPGAVPVGGDVPGPQAGFDAPSEEERPGSGGGGELPAGMHIEPSPVDVTGPQARVGSSDSVPGMRFNVPPPDTPGPQPRPRTPPTDPPQQ
jgi:hypothetical protein